MTEIGVQLPEIGVQLRPKPVFNFARNRCSTSSEKPTSMRPRVFPAEDSLLASIRELVRRASMRPRVFPAEDGVTVAGAAGYVALQ